jgi:hypothetical protein
MDEQQNDDRRLRISPPDLIVKVGAAALAMLALFLLIQSVKALKEFRYVGSGVSASNTISVSGMGEVFAVPDRATFSVTVREEAADVAMAQEAATEKANAIIAYLKGEGVEEKDIKTVFYNVNPKYEYSQGVCTQYSCPPSRQTLVGFEVYQSLEVKVQDPKKAGDLLSGVGGKGASEVSGLSFTIEDEDELKAEAREMAIAEARKKADELASQLGVNVVRVVGFYEDSGGYMPYGKGGVAMDMAVRSETAMAAPAPDLPAGENKIVSNVQITYEIR